jgi:hypothetical protein
MMLVLGAVVVGLILIGYGFHRLLVWAEKQGHIYYLEKPDRRPPPLGLLEQIYKPEMEYVAEEEAGQYVRGEDDESGRGKDDTEN